ncbi:MAG: 1-acyl-sn-glycerol-3-phosphate acyltransferase [Verrucomicrobiaceae bacterium]|nr:1-acyl-sn-glycerol-3-phosphate acyltransferase [Verrucomicrobiaceae bacterium]
MYILRSVLTTLFICIFAIGGFILGITIIPVVSIFSRKGAIAVLRASWIFFVNALEFFRLIKLEKKNINSNQNGAVIVANHPSLLDIVFLIASYKNSICIVKKSLSRNPFLLFIVNRIFIKSNEFDISVIDDASKAISQGINVIIFPEGTRSDNPKKKIRSGAACIAIHANCPIVPVKITCNPRILGKQSNPLSVSNRTVLFTLEQLPEIHPEKINLNYGKNSRLLMQKVIEALNLE